MPPHPDRVRRNYEEPKNKVKCPYCKSDKVTFIFRPEIYEYDFVCKVCEKGFNA